MDGEVAVFARARQGYQAIGDLLLDEEDSARKRGTADLLEDRRGDVVREVAGDGGGSPLGEVGLEDVGLVDFEARFGGEAAAHLIGKVAIHLDAR